ncbi:MAG TPA: PQQ-binding-like beta-propeller repeat protein [Thermoanaerobaculia bacterium]|nr:PQQ-binding-like beta-propeller repeat protein [Thermoanaerobaculia bacterium]
MPTKTFRTSRGPAQRLAFVMPLALGVLLALETLPARAAGLLGEGAVVDPAGAVAFVARPQGGIEAIELATGTSLWTRADAAKPLASTAGALLAQAEPGEKGELQLATLNPRTGALIGRSALALPAGVRAGVADNLQGSFRVRAVAAAPANSADTAVLLAWTATHAPLRGRRQDPLAGIESPAETGDVLRGAARLDLATGKVAAVALDEVARSTAESDDGFTSLDGRYSLVAERIEGALHEYRWTLADRATDKVAGVLDLPVSLAPFAVAGSAVVYLARASMRVEKGESHSEPLRLRALDLSTGAELWTREVRDSGFHGPFPP